MTGASILPIAYHNGQYYFLFGKENPMEDSSRGWSDFGGSMEKGETDPFKTAVREFEEETTGFFGDTIKDTGADGGAGGRGHYYHDGRDYHVHLVNIPYDEKLPFYYNNNHAFLWNRMNKKVLNDTKLFEKIEIRWFSILDIKKQIGLFRHFYRDIILDLLGVFPVLVKDIKKNKKVVIRTRTRHAHTQQRTRASNASTKKRRMDKTNKIKNRTLTPFIN